MVELPQDMLGFLDAAWFRYIENIDLPGPDHYKGGKYLLLPGCARDVRLFRHQDASAEAACHDLTLIVILIWRQLALAGRGPGGPA